MVITKQKLTAQNLAKLIYTVRRAVSIKVRSESKRSNLLQTTSNYLYDLCGRFALLAQARLAALTVAPPVISGPSNQNVGVGQNATFSTSVSSSVPYTVQWYDSNHNPIAGATSTTYVFTNAQVSDSGKTFYMKATNSAGTAVSVTVTLTVTAVITGFFTYSATTDFYPVLLTNSDPFTYPTTFNIAHNNPLVIGLPNSMPANVFMLVKVPIGESVKATWFNTPLNNGAIPDPVFEAVVQFGGFTYYASRGQVSMDVTQTLQLS